MIYTEEILNHLKEANKHLAAIREIEPSGELFIFKETEAPERVVLSFVNLTPNLSNPNSFFQKVA